MAEIKAGGEDILKENMRDLTMAVDTNITLESVILSEENRNKVEQFIKENNYRDKLIKYRLKPMNRLLFYGASGCGKTFLAKALSNHLNYRMLYIDIAKSLSDGNVAQNISDIFYIGNSLGNCLIFLDECDSIAWNRDSTSPDSGVIRRATNSLFQQLDQMNDTNIFISATNMLHRLDPAFERRFNMKLEFKRPQMEIKEVVERFMYKEFTLLDDVNETTKRIVGGSSRNKMSFYELEDITMRAMKRAVLNDTTTVKLSDVYNDIAVAQRIKLRFKTDADEDEIFESSIR